MSLSVFEPADVQLSKRLADRARFARVQGQHLTVGLCGPQGSGKSTRARLLKGLLEKEGLTAEVLSLDDFYLARKNRERLAQMIHPLLMTRGVPGTHDVTLMEYVLRGFSKPGSFVVPKFDKGRDDRLRPSEWRSVQAPVDVLIFEGWCIGAWPESSEALRFPINALEREEDSHGTWRRYVNDALAEEYSRLFESIDFLILLAAPHFDVVYRWRLQQERGLREGLRSVWSAPRMMSDEELHRFVAHYERLTRHILSEMPKRADAVLELDEQRRATLRFRS